MTPDPIFADARLAQIYDALDSDRSDLDAYAALAEELDARSVLDIGCGTGTLACLLASRGLTVTGVDPAEASLDVARKKAGAQTVTWLLGDASTLPPLRVDLALMTGNVAQVFLTDEDLLHTLEQVRAALRPGGRLVFEVRNPSREAWKSWNYGESYSRIEVPGAGPVESWVDLIDVTGELVTFRKTFVFVHSDEIITSHSTLRFREKAAIQALLMRTNFELLQVRDAPDRPGLEWVFVAQRKG